ncbi:MAG: TonB family protein [Candidatus Zixiibacteriota bacterium]|jgi:TonB family protein
MKAEGATIRYGAFELKRSYQKHLGLGVIIAGALHVAIICGFLVYSTANSTVPPDKPDDPRVYDPIDLVPPPISLTQVPQVPVASPQPTEFSIGIPEPVPDEEAPEDVALATQDDLGRLADQNAQDILGEKWGDSIVIKTPPSEYLPPPEKFVAYDELPVPINVVIPEYPPLARLAGIEGAVSVKALVDKEGTVREAFIFKESGSSAGFEEAALEVIYKVKFKPAISNNQPVAVWVVYPVRFTLK